jgi:uncharacterized membrane protein
MNSNCSGLVTVLFIMPIFGYAVDAAIHLSISFALAVLAYFM